MHSYCWAGGPPPRHVGLMKLQADTAVQVTPAALPRPIFTKLLSWWAPSSVPSGGKTFEVAFTILPPWIMLCLLTGSWIPVQTEPISQALPYLACKYLHATIAKWHLTGSLIFHRHQLY